MDLSQIKLSKTEWENIEIPVSPNEMKILSLICQGFHNTKIHVNENLSLFSFIKIEKNPDNEVYLYKLYFEKEVNEIISLYSSIVVFGGIGGDEFILSNSLSKKRKTEPKKIDIMRIENLQKEINTNKKNIIEFFMLDFSREILKRFKTSTHHFYLYTLIQLQKSSILNINQYVQSLVNHVVVQISKNTLIRDMVFAAEECIEKNPHLIKYEDMKLFSHQSELFDIFQTNNNASLVLYTAPTGTGKTLSPIGLSEGYRVIFVCVARHIGLSLAKSAVSMGKHIAFAFGCETASDIRLHNLSASEFIRNRKSGGIYKVDNSVGDKVEIMICDVKSYLIAMYYMLSFNSEENIITYWDEPTITMDYEEHELHEQIHKNWCENKISKLVLSCATLPRQDEISATLTDFQSKFKDAVIYNIQSYDCKKTISLVNVDGKCILPHILFRHYRDVLKSIDHCLQQKTLLRYFDLGEIIRFIQFVEPIINDKRFTMETVFVCLENINMLSLKLYYLDLLRNLDSSQWSRIFQELITTQKPKFSAKNVDLRKIKSANSSTTTTTTNTGKPLTKLNSVGPGITTPQPEKKSGGILLTTEDAHTLTDGPTIFLVEDVMKIGKFYIQQSKIPEIIFYDMLDKIAFNNTIQSQLESLDKNIEDELGKEGEKEKKMEREHFTANVRHLKEEFSKLQSQIHSVHLNHVFVPNTMEHQEKWIGKDNIVNHAFVPRIEEEHVRKIMMLNVETQMKILLLLGIGVFVKHSSVAYMEIMKSLAYEQKLFLIIASSDYIYGTNYQFCHGVLGKDLENMTQQKTIQAMGRIGRNNIQHDYTVRFRDDNILTKLFLPMERNMEAIQMSALFSSSC